METKTYELTEKEAKVAECGEICFSSFHDPENGKEVFDKEFKPLERYAILERIDILKRQIEMMDESEKRKKVA